MENEQFLDTVAYEIDRKTKLANIIVTGRREEGKYTGPGLIIYRDYGNSFIDAVNSLLKYHDECMMARFEGRESIYYGAGSDRGEWKDRKLVQWELNDLSDLVVNEKKLLEGIIGMHNQVCSNVKSVKV